MASDPFQLDRFVEAQAPVFSAVTDELRSGRKRSHWMWFVFPQLRGLGSSPRAAFYGIESLDEARAYLDHFVLGTRLVACTSAVLAHAGTPLRTIFGAIDAVKFQSSMTLFESAGGGNGVFAHALDVFCEGVRDDKTLAFLKS